MTVLSGVTFTGSPRIVVNGLTRGSSDLSVRRFNIITGLTIVCAAALHASPGFACDYPGGPPDAREVRAEGPGIVSAVFTDATTIYDHGVLGDEIEAGALRVRTDALQFCPEHVVVLGNGSVFEDVSPRISDVTGDGLNDVIVVETSLEAGASLAVYGMDGDAFTKLATTPHIGRRHRWLAPAGIADFDGDGVKDGAYVETPHIGGTLRIWSFAGGKARQLASAPGFSNHRIGQNSITGGVRDCGNGPELVLPSADWSSTRIVWLFNGVIEGALLAADAEPDTITRLLACEAAGSLPSPR